MKMKDKIGKIGDTIVWTFDDSVNVPKYLKGNTYSAEIAMVDLTEQEYGVYADYGQDLIAFDKCILHPITKENDMENQFKAFLKENEVFKEFVFLYDTENEWRGISLHEFLTIQAPEDYLLCAFIWPCNPIDGEKVIDWNSLNKEWKDKIS